MIISSCNASLVHYYLYMLFIGTKKGIILYVTVETSITIVTIIITITFFIAISGMSLGSGV